MSTSLRFAAPSSERGFLEHLSPQIAAWTVVYHCVTSALLFIAALWMVYIEEARVLWPFSHGKEERRPSVFLPVVVLVVAEVAFSGLLLAIRSSGRFERFNWEAVSLASAAAVSSALPWANPWHASALLGAGGADLAQPCSFVSEAEGAMMLFVVVAAAGFCALVPVRTSLMPVVPLCALVSYTVLTAVAGAPRPEVVPVRVCVLSLLLAMPVGSLRAHERGERSRWLAEQERLAALAEQPPTPDITFRLSDAGVLEGTSAAVHDAFFGCYAEGLDFESIVARADRPCLQKLLRRTTPVDSSPMVVTLNLVSGNAKVKLWATEECETASGEAKYIVSLVLLEDVLRSSRQLDAVALERALRAREAKGTRPRGTSDAGMERWKDKGCDKSARPWGNSDAGMERRRKISDASSTIERAMRLDVAPHMRGPAAPSDSLQLPGQPAMASDAASLSHWSDRASSGAELEEGSLSPPISLAVVPSSERAAFARMSEDSLMLSELSLTSEKSGERADLAQHPLRYARIRAPAATQTEPEAPRVNAAVNTTIVMDAFSFRCVACSKPPAKPKAPIGTCGDIAFAPVVPGPKAMAIIAKLDRQKGVHRTRSLGQNLMGGTPQLYGGAEYNGVWSVVQGRANVTPNEWLQHFTVWGSHVTLGDDSEAHLLQLGDGGPVLLCGGELRFRADGRLARIGQSGVLVEFVRSTNEEPASASCGDVLANAAAVVGASQASGSVAPRRLCRAMSSVA